MKFTLFILTLVVFALIRLTVNTCYSHELIVKQNLESNDVLLDMSLPLVNLNFKTSGNLNSITAYPMPTCLEFFSRTAHESSPENGFSGGNYLNALHNSYRSNELRMYEFISNVTLKYQYVVEYSARSRLFKILTITPEESGQSIKYNHQIYSQAINGEFSNVPSEQIRTEHSSLLTGSFAKFRRFDFFESFTTKTTSYGLYNSQNYTTFSLYKFDRLAKKFELTPSRSIKRSGIPCPNLNLRDIDGDGNADLVLIRALSNSLTPSQLITNGLKDNIIFYLDFYFFNEQANGYDDSPNFQYKFTAGVSNMPIFNLQFTDERCVPAIIKKNSNSIEKFYYDKTSNSFLPI